MGIVYVISILVLAISFILIKKTEKVIDILSFIGITIVTVLSFNVFICYILSFFFIPITLLSLSIINLALSIPIIVIMLKKKEIQKYKLDRLNFIFILIILSVTFIVSIFNIGYPFNIKYETGDPSTHYLTSEIFVEQDSLLNNYEGDVYTSFQTRKIGSYVNSGIIMKCFSNVMDEIDCYNIFIAFRNIYHVYDWMHYV